MKNFVQIGQAVDLVAPSGGVLSGVGVKIGALFAVAAVDALVGVTFSGYIRGVFDLAAEGAGSGQDMVAGDVAYWDDTNKRLTKTSTGNTPVAVLVADKATTATTARAVLVPRISEAAARVAALTENAGAIGGTNDGNIPTLTPTYAARTGSTGGTADGVWDAIGATNSGDVSGAIKNNFEEVKTVTAQNAADIVTLVAAVRELAAKINAIIAA